MLGVGRSGEWKIEFPFSRYQFTSNILAILFFTFASVGIFLNSFLSNYGAFFPFLNFEKAGLRSRLFCILLVRWGGWGRGVEERRIPLKRNILCQQGDQDLQHSSAVHVPVSQSILFPSLEKTPPNSY